MKKIAKLLLILFGLMLLSLIVWKKARPEAPATQPLAKVEQKSIDRLRITSYNQSVAVQKTGDDWKILSPVPDLAENRVIEELVESVTEFTIGYPVSEKGDRYPEFELDPAHAVHIEVFTQGKDTAALDAYIGKQAINFRSAFYRVEGSSPVYVASGLISSQWRRTPNAYRRISLFTEPFEKSIRVAVTQGKTTFAIKESSTSWVAEKGTLPTPQWAAELMQKVEMLGATDFSEGGETPAVLGFDKPTLVVQVDHPKGTKVLEIGKKAPALSPQDQQAYFARVQGRAAVMKIRADDVTALLDHLKALK